MEITVLGSGTYEPAPDRHCSSYLVRVNGQNIVFDFGRGALGQLMKCGVGYHEIDAIFITHTHTDHCAELVPLLGISLHELEGLAKRTKDITIYGPEGFGKTVEHILLGFNLVKHVPRHKVMVKEVSGGTEVKGEGWVVKCFRAEHAPGCEALIYRMESGGKSLVYTGDTGDCDGLREALRGADLAVVEATWPSEMKSGHHLTGEEAGKVALVSNVRTLVLTHLSPYYAKKFSPKADARRFFRGRLFVAKDLMKIRI